MTENISRRQIYTYKKEKFVSFYSWRNEFQVHSVNTNELAMISQASQTWVLILKFQKCVYDYNLLA